MKVTNSLQFRVAMFLVSYSFQPQILEFLNQHSIKLEECHGFVEGRGCGTAVVEIIEEIQRGIEDGNIPLMLGVDISSAFDCLCRKKC